MTTPIFAVDRIDTWVFKVAIVVPLVCVGGLVLWHLLAHLAGKTVKKREAVRHSPEPLTSLLDGAEAVRFNNDPERLQRSCAALVESLAEKYLELADSWLRQGQREQAALALREIVQRCPETRQAQIARDRLRQLGDGYIGFKESEG